MAGFEPVALGKWNSARLAYYKFLKGIFLPSVEKHLKNDKNKFKHMITIEFIRLHFKIKS